MRGSHLFVFFIVAIVPTLHDSVSVNRGDPAIQPFPSEFAVAAAEWHLVRCEEQLFCLTAGVVSPKPSPVPD